MEDLVFSDQQLAVSFTSGFVGLHERSTESFEAQDALMAFYRQVGLLCSGWELADDEAWEIFDGICAAEVDDRAKDAYLAALDVAVQNHHPLGSAALDLLKAIHGTQGMIVLRMHQRKQLEVGNV